MAADEYHTYDLCTGRQRKWEASDKRNSMLAPQPQPHLHRCDNAVGGSFFSSFFLTIRKEAFTRQLTQSASVPLYCERKVDHPAPIAKTTKPNQSQLSIAYPSVNYKNTSSPTSMNTKPLFLASILFISSCVAAVETDDPSLDSTVLSFTGHQQIAEYLSNDEDNDFKSFDSLYRHALNLLEEASEGEKARLLEEYADIVEERDDRYVPVISNSNYRKIINKDRIYISSQVAHKVVDNRYIVTTNLDNMEDLKKVSSISNLNVEEFKIIEYQNAKTLPSQKNLSSCSSYYIVDYFANGRRCRDDRRIWLEASAHFLIDGPFAQPWVSAIAYPMIRNGSCNWNSYTNPTYAQNLTFTSYHEVNGLGSYVTGSIPNLAATTSVLTIFNGPVGPIYVQPSSGFSQFEAIHMEASSQGVGADDPSHYAVIDCQ
jgi:hypothetical protein